jgi:DnaK suppressor protein
VVAKTPTKAPANKTTLANKTTPTKTTSPAKPVKVATAKTPPVVAVSAPTQETPAIVKPVVTRAARGSRLAQLTVPSMAQTVASTAAKASYNQNMSSPVVASPIFVPAKKDPKLANNWKTKPVADLTDAEVLSMSDDDYMNATQLAFFRLKLDKQKNDILNNAGETGEHLREDTVVVPDPADRATIEEEHAIELRTRDRERKLLKKIEQSLARIDSRDYGYCDETGEPIGVGRLIARPTASLSLEAQQRRELKQKMFGD